MAITNKQMTGLTASIWDDVNMGHMTGLTATNTGAMAGTISAVGAGAGTTIMNRPTSEAILDRYSLNEIGVEHRVQEFELMKLRESNVDYANVIKDNLAKLASKEVINKMTFTKKHEMDSDTHAFRGRIWVFTKDELKQMIEDIRNGV